MTVNLLLASVPVKASSVLMRALSKRSAVAWRMRHMLTWSGVNLHAGSGTGASLCTSYPREISGKLLAYNCSPSFNWQKNLDDKTIASFQQQLSDMGYKFQFITLAGIRTACGFNNVDLANAYAQGEGMKHYVEKVQQPEFAAAKDGYTFVSHQQEVGTGYFDKVTHYYSGRHVFSHRADRLH